jgi:alpha-L-rhamnosidase|tara:strand:- start:1239 stop:2333 length:1095 start_codon:yes stop_codon:yes gene_type:complete
MKKFSILFAITFIISSCSNSKKLDTSKLPTKIGTHAAVVQEEFIYKLDERLTPQCHASTIEVSNGIPVASWFGGTEEKNDDVGIWISRKAGAKWSVPAEVANGVQEDGTRYPCWNPVLFKPKNEPLILFYKVGPNPRTWWGLYMTSADDGLTWSKAIKLPKGILGPIKNQPIQLAAGTILSPTSTEDDGDIWKIQLEISNDSGKTWTSSGDLNDGKEFGAIQPSILNYGNGKLQLLSRTMNEVITQNWSYDYGKTWDKMQTTTLPNPNSGIDAISLKDGRQLLVYNPTGKNWGDRVPLSIGISTDGKKWDRVLDLEPLTPKTDHEGEEYSYPTMIQAADGLVHIVYTWNRETVKYVVLDPTQMN